MIFLNEKYQKPLPYAEKTFDKTVSLEKLLSIPNKSDIGYPLEVELYITFITKKRLCILYFVRRKQKYQIQNLLFI